MTNIFLKNHYRPIDKITYLKDNFWNFWKSQIIVEAFEHDVPKFEVALFFFIISNKIHGNTRVIFHEIMLKGHYMPPPLPHRCWLD